MTDIAVSRIVRAVAATAAAFILLPAAAHAQALFQPLTDVNTQSYTLPAGTTPLGVAVADFNHDGYPDMVVANKTDTSLGTTGTISVYLSSGSGGLQSQVKYPTCGGPTAVLAEDLDLTGLPDIVITCNTPTSNVIEVFINLGNGTFNPVVDGVTNIVLGTGLGPVSIISGDFNRDGHPDLATANSGDGTITLFLSNAANNFTYYQVNNISGFGTPNGITGGYFTQSGNFDLAVTDSSTNTVHILTGDGAGNFSETSTVSTGAHPTGIAMGDFNHDGFMDLATTNSGDGTVSVLLGHGDGTFSTSSTITVGPTTGTGASAIISFDVNNDGYKDLITADTLQNNVAVLINNGDGTFQAPQYYAVPNGPAYLAKGDFNRDGKPDLVVTQSTGSAVSILINNTLPTPQPGGRSFLPPSTLSNMNGNMATGITAGDFNHDGMADIAVSYFEDNAVKVTLGNGDGTFTKGTATYPVGKEPYWVASGDLNNDGYSDLVTANTGDNTVSVLMNRADGSGTFSAATSYPVGHLPYQVAVGDLNGDGIADIVATNYGDSTLSILYGQAGGGFTTGQTLTTCTNPYGVAIGDTRHTGQNDIAVTCFHTSQLEVFLNSSPQRPLNPPPAQATFQTPEIYTTSANPTSVVMGDFNRDGNLDIVTGNSIANNVSFFGGNGDGTFGSAVDSFALNFPDSIAAGDVNGDGILDIVAVAPNFNRATVLLGKGDGTFLPRFDFATGPQPWAVTLADVNRDGKLDILTADTYNRVNLTIPAYQQQYVQKYPPVPGGNPSVDVLLNASAVRISFTATPSSAGVNQAVTLAVTVAVSPVLGTTTPTGSVIIEDTNGTPSGSIPLANGTTSFTVPHPGSGTHIATVLYSGDTLYQPTTASGFVVTVAGTLVNLSFSPNPTSPTAPTAYTVTVGSSGASQPNPVGTVTLYASQTNGGNPVLVDGPHPIGTEGTGGVSTYSGTLGAGIPTGSYYLYATFTPETGSSYQTGSSPQTMLISK